MLVIVGHPGFVEAVAYYTAKAPDRVPRIAPTARVLTGLQSIAIVGPGFLDATGPAQLLALTGLFAAANLVLSAGLNAFNWLLIPSVVRYLRRSSPFCLLGFCFPGTEYWARRLFLRRHAPPHPCS